MRRIYGPRYIASYAISGLSFIFFIVFLIVSIISKGNPCYITISVLTLILSLCLIFKIFFIPINYISYNEYDNLFYIKLKNYNEYEIKPSEILDVKIEVLKKPTFGNLTLELKDSNICFKKINNIQEVKNEINKIRK